ncbi:DUF559 domain-containing protein [Demequina sp. TTPB684]|uniref:endonuclease domain-containing protein n=1 Tax=unclassified Demequina TaxID=2620311 RepID=UPI001CF47EA1|nr:MULTISPECIES: DUF559 domain-containing protein [unclassified Demequina]MCB2413356.1 DUF559 domain-containing protein [Demequina sp. TTPB684]UPU87494.1 DUF559 domain-containing protein [Demequina sp. TMPB413]
MAGAVGMGDLESALVERGGAVRWKTLVELGFAPSSLQRAVNRGAVERPARGVVAVQGASRDAIAVAALGGRLTCVSALRHLKVPLREDPDRIHVGLGVDLHRAIASEALRDVVIHRSVLLSDASGGAHRRGAGPTGVATAIQIASGCLGPLDHLIAVDGALRMNLISLKDLCFSRPSATERGLWLARHCDPRAESLLETVARWALTDAGYLVDTQVPIPGVGRVDLLVENSLVVELDGREHHRDREAFAADRRRDRALNAWGLRVLRFTYSDVLPSGSRVVEDVGAVLGARSAHAAIQGRQR